MSIDNTNDLLGKDESGMGIETHPVAFPIFRSVLVKRPRAVEIILEHLKDYQEREFFITPENYGLEVSVNYEDGHFQSMILKGTGERGERLNDAIALQLVPSTSKSKKKITLHAIVTIQEIEKIRGGITVQEIPRLLRDAFRNGFEPYEDKKIVYRVLRLYIDGEKRRNESVWNAIGNMVITGYSLEYDYESVKKYVGIELVDNKGYLLPQSGITIEDENPQEDKAFPETHFIFDDNDVIENPL